MPTQSRHHDDRNLHRHPIERLSCFACSLPCLLISLFNYCLVTWIHSTSLYFLSLTNATLQVYTMGLVNKHLRQYEASHACFLRAETLFAVIHGEAHTETLDARLQASRVARLLTKQRQGTLRR